MFAQNIPEWLCFWTLVGCLVTLHLWTLRDASKKRGRLHLDMSWPPWTPNNHSAILKPPNKTQKSQPKKQPLKTCNKTLPHFSIYLHSIPLGKDPWRTTPISLGLSWPLTKLAAIAMVERHQPLRPNCAILVGQLCKRFCWWFRNPKANHRLDGAKPLQKPRDMYPKQLDFFHQHVSPKSTWQLFFLCQIR